MTETSGDDAAEEWSTLVNWEEDPAIKAKCRRSNACVHQLQNLTTSCLFLQLSLFGVPSLALLPCLICGPRPWGVAQLLCLCIVPLHPILLEGVGWKAPQLLLKDEAVV